MSTIRAKLYLLVAVLLIFGSINAFMGTTGMNQGLASMDSVYKNRIVPLHSLEEIADAYAISIVDTAQQVKSGVLSPAEGLAIIERAEQTIRNQWGLYLKTILTEEEKKTIVQLKPQIQSTAAIIAKLKVLLKENDLTKLERFNNEELYPSITPLASALSDLAEYQLGVAMDEYKKYKEQYDVTLGVQLFFISTSFLIGLGMAYWLITHALIKPLREADSFAMAIASGDLSRQIEIENKDEIGKVLLSLMVMQTRLRIIVSEIQSKARELSSTSGRLSETAEAIESATLQQDASAHAMVDTVGNLAKNIAHNSKNSEVIHRIIEHSGTVAQEGEEIVSHIDNEVTAITGNMTAVVLSMEELNTMSEQIRLMINDLKELATQTDQLAQDTSSILHEPDQTPEKIAIVAGELRLCAERTAQSTTEIVETVDKVSTRIIATVQAMEEQVQHIQESNALAARVGTVVKTIDVESRQVLKTVENISTSLEEQSQASAALEQYVDEITQINKANNSALESTASHISRLKKLSDKMIDSINQFRL